MKMDIEDYINIGVICVMCILILVGDGFTKANVLSSFIFSMIYLVSVKLLKLFDKRRAE
jgi:hypothetical protein